MPKVANPLPVLILALATLAASPALSAEAADDTPVATASAGAADPTAAPAVAESAPQAGAPLSVTDQIDAFLRSSPVVAIPRDDAPGVTTGAETRKVHGEASIAVGTGGYRSVYLRSDVPVGKTGTLSVAVEDTRFGRRGGYDYGYPYGLYGHGGPAGRQSLGIGLSLGGEARPDALGLGCRSWLDPERPYADTPERRACLQRHEDGPRRMRRAPG